VATWTYLPFDGPRYPIGNGINLAAASLMLIITSSFYLWMKYDNRKRDQVPVEERNKVLDGLSEAEVSSLEYKHPDFRWKP
jgi:hypothetical protein